jgi:hypothetical protein
MLNGRALSVALALPITSGTSGKANPSLAFPFRSWLKTSAMTLVIGSPRVSPLKGLSAVEEGKRRLEALILEGNTLSANV